MRKRIRFILGLILVILLGSIISSNSLLRPTYAQQDGIQGQQDSDGDSIPDERDACPSNSNWISPCLGQEALDAQNQNTQAQVSIMECVISTGTCTGAEVLLNDNYEIICDPRQSDCSSYLTSSSSTVNEDQAQIPSETPAPSPAPAPSLTPAPEPVQSSIPGVRSCNPATDTCYSTDLLINDVGEIICDPAYSDCSGHLKSQGEKIDSSQFFPTCNPNKNTCNADDVLVDDAGNTICDPIMTDCSTYLVSTPEPLEKYRDITGGNPNAMVLQVTDPPAQYCNPRSENCTPDHKQIPGMQPWGCFVIITTDEKVCDSTPKAQPNVVHSMWTHYPIPNYAELLEVEEKQKASQDEQAEIDRFSCEFADHASEKVGTFAACWKVRAEVKEALHDPTKTVSRSEVAFCGIGTASMAEHELSIMDVPAYLAGKLSKGVCKLTHLVTDEDRDRNKELIDYLNGEGNSVKYFIQEEWNRIDKERPLWCEKYGVTPEDGHCWGLEIDYDKCAKAQKFWSEADPERYGIDKPIKLRDGSEVPNQLGFFEYPCTFPPIPAQEDQVCAPETNSCTLDPSLGS